MNRYEIQGDTTVIFLDTRNGQVECFIDTKDLEKVWIENKWYFRKRPTTNYAYTNVYKEDGTRTSVQMHNVILGDLNGLVTDHIDRNGLNNRRSNLRRVTQQVNSLNRRSFTSMNTSGYSGIVWKEERKKWKVELTRKGVRKFVGYYSELEAAVKARDEYLASIGSTPLEVPRPQPRV